MDRTSPVTYGEVKGEVHEGSQIFSLDILEEVVHLAGNRRGRKIFSFILSVISLTST